MRVILKVLEGSSAGKLLPVNVPTFFIGRGDDCHLRPNSSMISRRHCAIAIKEGRVAVHEFGSKNGTFINGERVNKRCEVANGDTLQVGPLKFAVLLDHSLGGTKKSKVKTVREAASRTSSSDLDDSDISKWLEEEDEADRAKRIADPETRQFKVDMSKSRATDKAEEDDESKDPKAKKKKKKEPGKLPTPPEDTSTTSSVAAEKMLKKFFQRDSG